MNQSGYRLLVATLSLSVLLAACGAASTATPSSPLDAPIPSVTAEPLSAANVWFLGQNLGGRSSDVVKRMVAAAPFVAPAVTLQIGGTAVPLPLDGVSVDVDATTTALMHTTTGITVTPVLRVDTPKIATALTTIQADLAKNSGITLVGADQRFQARFVGAPAQTFDLDAAKTAVVDAIKAGKTSIELPLTTPAGDMPVDSATLNAAIADMAKSWDGVVGVYVWNLDTDTVVASLNENTVFSGASVMKVPILLHAYSRIKSFDDDQIAWMRKMIIHSDNIAANKMLATSMDGQGTEAAYQGAQDMNAMFKALGLEHTYQNLPYEAREYLIGTMNYNIKGGPKEEGPPPFTDADPMLRTTPREMSTVFHAIYRCSQGDGPLLQLYPDTLSAQRCTDILMLMRENADHTRMMRGLPDDVIVSHKSGWIEDMQADVGIITTPANQHYLMAVYVYRPIGADGVFLSDPLASDGISGFARLIHSAFVPAAK